MKIDARLPISACIGFLIVAPTVLIGASLPDTETWRGWLGVAVGCAWVVYWCWELAAVWSGLNDLRRRNKTDRDGPPA